MSVRFVALAAVVGLVSLAAGAREAVSAPRPEYEAAFRRANAYAEEHAWAKAREQYQVAYDIEPRPILLFNIGSTYYFEGDRTNARVYYRWYLDTAGPDATYAADARDRLAELTRLDTTTDAPPISPPAAPAVHVIAAATASTYPAAAIARPLTLPSGVFEIMAGSALAAYDASSVMSTGDRTVRGFATASYALRDQLEATVGGLGDAGFGRDSYGLAELTYAFADQAGVRGEVVIGSAADVFVAIPYRIRIGTRFAITSTTTNAVQVRVDGDHRVMVALPAGVGVQVVPSVYATVETAIARYDSPALGSSHVRALIADYGDVTGTVTIVPRSDLDVMVEAVRFEAGVEALAQVRLRL